VNVFGVLNVLRGTLPVLRKQRSGHVLNIASIGGFVGGFSGWGVYCATKFALAGLTEALHADLAELGINVTLVYPGYFRTEFLAAGSRGLPTSRISDYASARASERAHTDTIAGNQPGDPAKLARALVEVAASNAPPLHLFLGPDAFDLAKKKLAGVAEEMERHAALSRSTNFDS
jgi:NAD(P)-dependent dehydrogenase (short-subunit alcohol dehydrogenase family)